jgi:hypothetical protein
MTNSMSAVDTEVYLPDETERVICWRASELIRAGYDPNVAVDLAERQDVDLHRALELVERGCPLELATQILI